MEKKSFENISNSVIKEETVSDETIEKLSQECFLREYELLCQKYKMGLQGCGCCGSPYLYSNHNDINEINYNYELNKVFINGDGYWHEQEKKGTLREEYKECKEEEKTIEEYFKEQNEEE